MNEIIRVLKELKKINYKNDIIEYLKKKENLNNTEYKLQKYISKLRDNKHYRSESNYLKDKINSWIETMIESNTENNKEINYPFKFKYDDEHSEFSKEVLNDINKSDKYGLVQTENGKNMFFTKKIIVLDFYNGDNNK